MEEEDSLSPKYYFSITNDNHEDLKFVVFNLKIDICEDLREIKELFKVLTARKMKRSHTTTDEIKEHEIDCTRNWLRNIPAKRIGKKKFYLPL